MKNKSLDNKTRVRFAPSPTGSLHIGSARTALFNWLYARKTGGCFIIRIEDTDLARHQEEAIGLMLESLKWLGMDWDEGPDTGGDLGPYRQSERLDIYRKTAQGLIEDGKAYICFCSPEDLAAKRKSCQKNGGAFKYDRSCLSLSAGEITSRTGRGEPYTIRLLVPENKILEFDDTVYGRISVNSDTIEDYIIIRSNGLPTYNYSVAVDDALMKITHIIRGEDHLSNTPKQLLVYNAMGIRPPQFIHLPMILGSDGQKLSKRHGSISIEAYREEGFMPEAIINYITLLGWAYDEKTTIFSISDLISRFSPENINKKSARFDYQKLLWMNGNYIRGLDDSTLEKLIIKEVSSFLDSSEVLKRLQNGPGIEEVVKRITPHIK
ncbi:MAG: glutamate--tRNA ligase, partial [Actinomycetota bacterium]